MRDSTVGDWDQSTPIVESTSEICGAWVDNWNSLLEVGFDKIANGSGEDGGGGGGLGDRNRALFRRARFSLADSRALESRVLERLQLLLWLLNAFV